MDREVKEGDTVLLEKKRENKLSPSYEKESYEVISRYGDQVVVQLPQGVQYKRNLQHVKPFLTPDREDRESTLQAAEPPNETKATELPPLEEDPVPMAESPPDVGSSVAFPADEPLRRSERIARRPKRLNCYVLYQTGTTLDYATLLLCCKRHFEQLLNCKSLILILPD